MTRVMPSETDQDLMAGYILGNLSPEEGRALKQQLSVNPALGDEMAGLQTILDGACGAELTPPARLKNNILAAVTSRPAPLWAVPQPQPDLPQPNLTQPSPQALDSQASGSQTSSTQTADPRTADPQTSRLRTLEQVRSRRVPQWLSYGFGAAAATVAIALGIQNYTLRQSVQTLQAELTTALATSELATGARPEATLTFALDTPENTPVVDDQAGEVTIAVSPAELEAVLNAQGLQPLPEDQVYALWVVIREGAFVTTDAKNAVLMTTFNVDEEGNQTQEVAIPSVFRDVADVKAIAVTVESATAPQQHQSSPILIEQL